MKWKKNLRKKEKSCKKLFFSMKTLDEIYKESYDMMGIRSVD